MSYKRVGVKIVKIEGEPNEGETSAICTFGHKVGDEFIFDEFGCNKPMCIYAQGALLPAINAMIHGGSFPWLPEGEELHLGCPHPGPMYKGLGQIIFYLHIIE
jgi:uncharacterized repeat protein (TIGR04076 family)